MAFLSRAKSTSRVLSSFNITEQEFSTSSAKKLGRLSVDKDSSLADELIHLEISGLSPEQKITLHSSVSSGTSAILESFGHYVADHNGYISLAKHQSVGGDYHGIEPMGPLSFMKPSILNKRKHHRFMMKDPTKPFQINFRVFEDFIHSLDDTLAQNRFQIDPDLSVSRTYVAPGVVEIPVWDGKVRATLYLPPGKGPFPGVVSMSGGYPGAMKYKAALLASHGFAALALKYFGEDDLSDDFFNVKIEYVEEAVRFMMNNSAVDDKNGVGVVANCYGATIALAAASVLPEGLIRCVACINGWSFPSGQLTYKGECLTPKFKPILLTSLSSDGIRRWNYCYAISGKRLDKIQSLSLKFFERHDISYLFVAGKDDGYVPAKLLSSVTKDILESAGHPDYEVVSYEGAGHLIEHQYYPLARVAWTFGEAHLNGGKQPFHSSAQNDSWPRILNFLSDKLETHVG